MTPGAAIFPNSKWNHQPTLWLKESNRANFSLWLGLFDESGLMQFGIKFGFFFNLMIKVCLGCFPEKK